MRPPWQDEEQARWPSSPARPATTRDAASPDPGSTTATSSPAAAALPARPWFAIGGITPHRLDDVLAAGATRVVVVRVITEADDPAAATRALAQRLRAAS